MFQLLPTDEYSLLSLLPFEGVELNIPRDASAPQALHHGQGWSRRKHVPSRFLNHELIDTARVSLMLLTPGSRE
jgi:hypothetical protein